MITLSKKQIIILHSQLISETGGTDGIRDEGLLDSAISAPFQSFAGTEIYPSIQQKAARLGYGDLKQIILSRETVMIQRMTFRTARPGDEEFCLTQHGFTATI